MPTGAVPWLWTEGVIWPPSSREVARTATCCFLVLATAALLLFSNLGAVRAPIWDEAYYLPSTARYHEGRVQFATHPPLGLMLIAAGDAFYGQNAKVDQSSIAAVKSIPAEAMPPGYDYLGPRLAPALFGVIGAGLFFLLMRRLSGSDGAGLMLSGLYLCDTAFLGQFRAAHLDPFQICFALAALLCLVGGLREPSAARAAGFGFWVACAALVRANAIILAPVGIFLLWPVIRAGQWQRGIGQMAAGIVGGVIALALVAVLNAAVSPRLPDPATPAGAKDIAFVSPSLVATGRVDPADPGAILALTQDYARFMAADHEGMTRQDANGSHPWQWLLGQRAITYRWDASDHHVATVALIPNLAAWMLSLAGVLWTIWSIRRGISLLQGALLAGWLLNMVVLFWLDAERVLYLYSYFLPLLIGYALLAFKWRERALPSRLAYAALAAITLCFVVAAPLALHRQVPIGFCRAVLHDCGR